MTTQLIRVVYPLQQNSEYQLVLRSSLEDWNQDIEPTRTGPDWAEFEIRTSLAYFHFKPCLRSRRHGTIHWSLGSNYLSPVPQRRHIYPHFFSDESGSVSELKQLISATGQNYRYRIYLPPGYHENSLRRYPICFMHDGHNLFFPEEAFAGQTWRVQQTVDALDRMNSIETCIIVALYPNDRFRDYTQPGCVQYAKFLTQTLIPEIDSSYRTLSGPGNRVVMGSSLGGLVSFYLAWNYPEVFGRAACLSSTFGYDNKLLRAVKRSKRKRPVKIYLDSGWPGDNFSVTQAMAHLLISKGYNLGSDVHYVAVPQASHDEVAWASRLHLPFQLLLGLSYGSDQVIDPLGLSA